jgi:hypothetical protein
MRKVQVLLAFTFILLSISSVSAQYGSSPYGGGGGMNNRGGGMNSGMSQLGQSNTPSKPKEISAEEKASQLMDLMKPALNLDELQVIAISNVLVETANEQGRIRKLDSNQEDQMKDFEALSESTDRKINQFLSTEQKEKYAIFKVDNQNQPRTKDKSKSKDKKEKKE